MFGNNLGLEIHAGHGLNFKSAKILSKTRFFLQLRCKMAVFLAASCAAILAAMWP